MLKNSDLKVLTPQRGSFVLWINELLTLNLLSSTLKSFCEFSIQWQGFFFLTHGDRVFSHDPHRLLQRVVLVKSPLRKQDNCNVNHRALNQLPLPQTCRCSLGGNYSPWLGSQSRELPWVFRQRCFQPLEYSCWEAIPCRMEDREDVLNPT